ncbi:hypothetical protein [Ulvibacterium sp.]|uniref:hypothetical protein n=1 Tax=Ulvibacterium sp. TaxID=2665914 RepID=UPI003CC608A5
MSRIKFKCKGNIEPDVPCDKYVSTKRHKGLSIAIEIQELQRKVKTLEGRSSEAEELRNQIEVLDSVPDVPTDWEFTLTCSRGHEEDYTYDEREQ